MTRPPVSPHSPRCLFARGFTLIELMVTIVIIGVLAALATPGIVERVRSAETRSSAENIASTYRLARQRAMGRGAAVLVRYVQASGITTLSVLEGVRGGSVAGCELLPEPSCLTPATRWDTVGTSNQLLQSADASVAGEYTLTFNDGSATRTTMDVCFTPLGRAFSRSTLTNPLAAMTGAAEIEVVAADGGLPRQVLILPNGTSRVVAAAL